MVNPVYDLRDEEHAETREAFAKRLEDLAQNVQNREVPEISISACTWPRPEVLDDPSTPTP